MEIYLVGGAVRDKLLGLDNFDKDYVVVGADKQKMLNLGFKQIGKNFPVFLHPKTKEEYALARIEKKINKGYKGFEVKIKNITLKEDLSRRDLTINSMAIDKNGKLIDYFNGRKDLQMGVLRHTSKAFIEDPVRVLRIARFAAKLKPYGFKVAHSTFKLIKSIVKNNEVDNLTGERIFLELQKSLSYKTPSIFFKILENCGAYERIFYIKKNNKTHSNNFIFLDNLNIKIIIKFSLWLNSYSLDEVKKINKILKTPKKYKEISVLSVKFKDLAQNFAKITHENKLNFFIKLNSLRNKERFFNILEVWKLQNIETKIIKNIFNKLITIKFDITAKNGILKLQQQRLEVIENYVG